MSVKLQPNMTQNARDLRICEDYWTYDNESNYIAHVETICEQYEISPQLLFETIGECFAYLDDVRCEYCGYACPIEVPADIPYMRAKDSWLCTICDHALWRTDKEKNKCQPSEKPENLSCLAFLNYNRILILVKIYY